MRVVIYATDFEPITVVELSDFAMKHLEKHGRVPLAISLPPILVPSTLNGTPDRYDSWQVNIWAERLNFHGNNHLMLFTRDEESALLLKATFLAGQRSSLQELERGSYARGFLRALQNIGQ